MLKRFGTHFRSNVVGYVALFVVLGGSAYALPGKGVIDKNDLRKGVVKTKNLKANAATGAKVNEGTLDFACATGLQEVNGDCFETTPRTADDWQHASDTCADANGFLPSYQQLNAADQELGIDVNTEPDIWTENRWDDGASDFAHVYTPGTEIPSSHNAGGAEQFICVFPLIRK